MLEPSCSKGAASPPGKGTQPPRQPGPPLTSISRCWAARRSGRLWGLQHCWASLCRWKSSCFSPETTGMGAGSGHAAATSPLSLLRVSPPQCPPRCHISSPPLRLSPRSSPPLHVSAPPTCRPNVAPHAQPCLPSSVLATCPPPIAPKLPPPCPAPLPPVPPPPHTSLSVPPRPSAPGLPSPGAPASLPCPPPPGTPGAPADRGARCAAAGAGCRGSSR